jgi:RNA recognition motif-containing protein
MNIYVGNLSFSTKEEAVRELFEQYGEVEQVRIITDRDTGRPRGFAFVEMPNDKEAQSAIEATNGAELDGRTLKVNQAKPKGDRRPPRQDRW